MIRPCVVWLERFFVEQIVRAGRAGPERPLAVYSKRRQVVECNVAAQAHGVRPGMRLKEATSRYADLALFPVPDGGGEALLHAGRRLLALSPLVSMFGERDLVVDLAPSAHLFGGERGLLSRVVEACAGEGFSVRAAAGCSLAGAWLASRLATSVKTRCVILSSEREARFFDALPLAPVLALPEFAALRSRSPAFPFLGLATLREVAKQARHLEGKVLSKEGAALLLLARRSAELERQAVPLQEPPEFAERLAFFPSLADTEPVVLRVADALSQRILPALERYRLLPARIRFTLVSDAQDETVLEIGPAHPTRKVRVVLDLLRLKLAEVTLADPLCECRVEVVETQAEARRTGDLLSPRRHGDCRLEELTSRLEGSLFAVELCDALLPEDGFTGAAIEGLQALPTRSPSPSLARPARSGHPFPPEGEEAPRYSHDMSPSFFFLPPLPAPRSMPPEDLRPTWMFDLFDPVAHAVISHRYFWREAGGGRRFLLKQEGDGPFSLVAMEG